MFHKVKAALLAAAPHWRQGPWQREWDQRIHQLIDIARRDIARQERGHRRFGDKEKGTLIGVSRNQWQNYNDYWYQIVLKAIKAAPSRPSL